MQYESRYRPSAAEFPHDNPLVDRGALWVGSALCVVETALGEAPETETDLDAAPVEDVDEAPVEVIEVAPIEPVEVAPNEPVEDAPVETSGVASPDQAVEAEPSEVAAEKVPSDGVPAEAPANDPVAAFVQAVTEVALAYGPAETAAQLEALFHFGTLDADELSPSAQEALFAGNILESTDGKVRPTDGFTSTSAAWRSILRGESGDLSACGDSTLDNWTADLVARLVASPDKASTIRRDLRRRGIAAFGMLG